MLVTERPGRLRIVRSGALLPEPVQGLPSLRVGGQGGLLDVMPHPAFASNRLIYFSYSKPSDDTLQGGTAVARARFENDRLTNVQDIFVATGDRFPQWRGNFFAGGMVGEQLARLTMDGRRVTNVETLVQRMGRIRDVRQGPDGFIYLAIQHDNQLTPILRLEPVPGN